MRTERKTFKYKLEPTAEQEALLSAVLHQCRVLYNLALEERRTAWKYYRKRHSRNMPSFLPKRLKT